MYGPLYTRLQNIPCLGVNQSSYILLMCYKTAVNNMKHPEFTQLPIPVYQVYEANPLLPKDRDELIYLACKVNEHVLNTTEEALVCGLGLYQNKYPIVVIHYSVEFWSNVRFENLTKLYDSRINSIMKLGLNYDGREILLQGRDPGDVKIHWLRIHRQTGLPGYLHDEDVKIVLGRRLTDGPEHTIFWDV